MTASSPTLQPPPHVAPRLVYDFDFAADAMFQDASGDIHARLLKLHREAPEIFYTPRYDGAWVVRGYDAAYEITHDVELFSSHASDFRPIPIAADGDEHEMYRRALLQVFSPKTITGMTPIIQSMATELVGKVADKGECEFVSDVAEPMPVIVFMKMLGLPIEMMAPLRKLILAYLGEGDPDKREIIRDEMHELLDPVIRARMAQPRDDMLSRLTKADLGGRPATFDELRRYLWFLSTAGLDTVVNAICFSVMHLAKDLDLQRRLRADLGLLPDAIEEFLRRYSPSTIFRTVTRDVNFRGVDMRKGDRVTLLLPAVNLDEAYFPDPERILLGRENPAVTFGAGAHRCLGSHLARFEMKILLTEWLTKIPEFTLDADKPPWVHPGMVYSMYNLNLRWQPELAVSHA